MLFFPVSVLCRIFAVLSIFNFYILHKCNSEYTENLINEHELNETIRSAQTRHVPNASHERFKIWHPCEEIYTHDNCSRILNPVTLPILTEPVTYHTVPEITRPTSASISCTISYTRTDLLLFNHGKNLPDLSPEVKANLHDLGIQKRYRGRRGGRHIHRSIPVIITSDPEHVSQSVSDYHDYVQPVVQPSVDFRPRTLISIPLIDSHASREQNRTVTNSKSSRHSLPTIFMTNAQSLGNKFDEAAVIFEQNLVDIAVITESWFSNNIPEHQLNFGGYTMFSKHREHQRGGGVAIYVKEDIPSSSITDISVPDQLECRWVKVRPNRLPRGVSAVAVCAVYIVTDSPYQELLTEHLLQSVDFLRSKYPELGIVITGDFNRMNIAPITRGNDLFQLIDFPTRGKATLDFIITNSKLQEYYNKPQPISPLGFSDHSCVLWKPIVNVRTKNSAKYYVGRPITDSGIEVLGSWLQNQDWHDVLNCIGTQNKVDLFYSMLESVTNVCFPIKRKKVHCNDKPWITTHIKNLIIARQKAFESDIHEWRRLRNAVKREVIKAKKSYHADRIRVLQETNPRKWHQQIRVITNNTKSELRLNIPGINEDDCAGKANAVNNLFVNVSAHIEPLDRKKLTSFLPAKTEICQLYPWEVYSELQKVNPSKAGGPDGIKPQLVKEFAYELSIPLTDILNSSFREGIVPSQWKKAIVVPIPKTNPPSIDKLRPVSLTSIFSKVAEGFITKWILDDIECLIDVRQFGNVPGVSTSHYLLNLIHFLNLGAEKSQNVGTVVLTDFSKAFDLINHTLLIEKMINIGVRRSIIPWICDFLHNRQQCVKLNDTLSEYVFVNGGVPQGTKLGPLGFQILINDAASDAKTEYWKYVDDMTFAENRNVKQKGGLQEDLNKFQDWSETNGLKLNPSKCQALQINFGKSEPLFSELTIGNEPLSVVNKAKILGLWVQNDLKWDAQINNMLVAANRRLFMLRSLKKFGFDKKELTVVLKSYLRPVLEYSAAVWHSGITVKQRNELERIQRRACKTILGPEYTSYNDALLSCNLESLDTRRTSQCLKFAIGLSDNIRSKHLLPPTRIQSHGRNLRNANSVSQFKIKTSRFRNSPVPYFINLLNNQGKCN